jgi:GNAT superfamily N-acetyltransferase
MIIQLDEAALPLALDFRLRMMTEAGVTPLLADDWRELTHKLYTQGYRDGTIAHFGWQQDGHIVATAGVMIRDDYPFFTFKARRYGWIMDVYVIPEYRRRGYARQLTEHTLTWLRGKGVAVARLSTSAEAKKAGLYERMGFTFANEMRMWLNEPTPTP